MSAKEGLLERLAKGPVIGDGGMCWTLERRGYCKAGPWTPEAVIEHPDAVRQLHREYLRAGADVIQTASFYASDDKLSYCGTDLHSTLTTKQLNDAACKLATEVAAEGNALVCGSLSPVPSFSLGKPRDVVANEFKKQVHVYEEHKVDFVLGEFFNDVEEAEIAVEVMKTLNVPVAINMRLGPAGDIKGRTVEECGLRMARSGADVIGVNCMYDVNTCLKVMKRIKAALVAAKVVVYLMCQPFGYLCPEVEDEIGYVVLPEAPLCLESRQLTRVDAHKFARAAWEIGIRYIGGCCGMESHHIRSLALELTPERNGKLPPCHDYCEAFGGKMIREHSYVYAKRSTREYWYNVKVGSGRPFNPALSEHQSVSYEYETKTLKS